MSQHEFIDLPPLMSAHGTVRLPGSKSISNRVLLLAALSEGVTVVRDLLKSDDTDRMLDALRTLGVTVESLGENAYCITGCGGNFPRKDAKLFLGNAGTAFRPLTAALALAGGHYELSGVPRMHERPIGDLVDALRQLGADIRGGKSLGKQSIHAQALQHRLGGLAHSEEPADRQGGQERPLQIVHQRDGDVAAEHGEAAVRQVDEVHHPQRHRQPHRQQEQQHPVGKPVEQDARERGDH